MVRGTVPATWPAMALTAILAAVLVGARPGAARAAGAEAEAKQTAAANNCKPGKIEVARRRPGGDGEVIYKVTCTDYQQMEILIQCRQRLCVLLR